MIVQYPPLSSLNTPISKDYAGRQAFHTVFGEAVVGMRDDSISCLFQYNNSTRDVRTTTTGSGTTSNADSQAIVAVDTAVGLASLVSVDTLRYRPGHEANVQFTTAYVGAQSGVNQYHGLMNGADGAAFGTKDGVFGVWFIKDSVETFYPQSSWVGDKCDGTGPSGFTLDPTKLNIFMVQFGWLGAAPIAFSVYTGALDGWVTCHRLEFANTQLLPHLSNPTLPITMKVERASGTGTAANIRTSSWRGGVTAGPAESANSSQRWFAHTELSIVIAAASARNNVFTLRNEATFQGKTNHVVVELGIVTFDNAGNKTVAFYGTKNATLVGAGAYAAKDASNSVISVATGGTITGGTQGPATVIKAGGDRRTDVRGTGIIINPGETFTFEVVAATFTGDISLSARWVEYF